MMELDPKALLAVLSGEATEQQRKHVEHWCSLTPANDLEYKRCERIWHVLGTLEPATDAVSPSLDPVSTTARTRQPSRNWRAARPAGSRRLAAAAALAAATVLIILTMQRVHFGGAGSVPLLAGDVVTGVDEVRTVHLSDGTIVRMGPETRLGPLESRGPRDVFVEGRAYFVVPGGRPQPFRVHSGNGQIEVVGTRFDVAATGEALQVLVVEGEVALEANDETVSLQKGEAGTALEASPPVVDVVEDIYGVTAWIGYFAAYEGTPLSDIAEEFRRRYDFEIEIADPALADRTVSGLMRDQSVEDMAASVCLAVSARCTFEPGRMTMEAEPAMPAAPPSAAPVANPPN